MTVDNSALEVGLHRHRNYLPYGFGARGTRMADTSLLPVIVGGALALAGTLATIGVTVVRDAVQHRREKQKRREDKFEELVAAVYELDHWIERIEVGADTGQQSPFSKVQSITSVYFPQFIDWVGALALAGNLLLEKDFYKASGSRRDAKAVEEANSSRRNAKVVEEANSAYEEARDAREAYIDRRNELLTVLQSFACNESFNSSRQTTKI
jgi:hypothetical protein